MVAYGLAVENFTSESVPPSFERILDYATSAESLGFDSLWAWDHLFLGARRAFPFLECLTTLTAIAAQTDRITLGSGVLVLPLRDPVALAKTTASLQDLSRGRLNLGLATGWYEREFQATGVPFRARGRIFERNLTILERLWDEDDVSGGYDGLDFHHVRMLPRPTRRPRILIGGYVDRVLRRVATRSDGWLTYFYRPASFAGAWSRVLLFAEEVGRDPRELTNVAQVPLCIDQSYEAADRKVTRFVNEYFDCPEWSESTPDSAIRGTPQDCAEQISEHLAAGVQHVVFVPYRYELEQVERLAKEVLPLLKTASDGLDGI